MTRLPTKRLLGGAAVVIAVALLFTWLVPTDYYLYLPNEAQPLAAHVVVPGERPSGDGGGIYYVDVSIRPATWPERLFSFLRPNGSSMLAKSHVFPRGSSLAERRAQARAEMDRSKQVAAAVALRRAGYRIDAQPRGVLVEGIDPTVPARDVLKDGDVIVGAEGGAVRTPADLRRAVAARDPGDEIPLKVRRGGKVVELQVRTVADPADATRPLIGIRIGQAADIRLPLAVKIDLGDVGGPSAGLPFALDVLEELGRDIDHGYKVAATGELELDGAVAPIGGVKQKTLGAREAGADIFVVPAGENEDEARRYAGDLRVIGVESFQQALSALQKLPRK